MVSSKQARLAVSRPTAPSCFSVTGFKGMAVETQVLKNRGIFDTVILTMKVQNIINGILSGPK